MYNLCDYLTYQCVFFVFFLFFFSNNVGSYDPWSDPTIHDLTYLPRSYVGSRFWQPWLYPLQVASVINISLVANNICSFLVFLFDIILLIEVVHIWLLWIIFFLISFRTTKIFKFQMYYLKFSFSRGDYHDNKKIIT